MLLISGGTVVTLGDRNRVLDEGAVLIDGDTIADVGTLSELRSRHRELDAVPRLDAAGHVVMPGLVCAHHHLYSTFARGMPMSGFAPADFVGILSGLWWKLDLLLEPGDVRLSALPVLMEGLRAGTTTVIDHHESQGYQSGVLDELAGACREAGVRACLTLGASDRMGRGRAGLEENRRFLAALGDDPIVRGMVGLHAPFTVSADTLGEAVQLARDRKVGLHVHVAEDKADQNHSQRRFGMRCVPRLEKAGALGRDTLLAHAIHLEPAERERVAATGSWILHNPESNMNNAVGAADVLGLTKAGIPVALGTDGMSSDMRAQARSAYLLQRHLHRDSNVAFGEALTMLLSTNAKLASAIFGRPIGELAKGAAADVVLYRYEPPTPLTEANFGGHFLFGIVDAPVSTALVGGRVRLDNGVFPGLDASAVMAQSREASTAFWKRFAAARDVTSDV
jgi:putative selenium metabolism protein SsnA